MTVGTYQVIAAMITEIYARNAVGCCLHIVLDDGNWSVDHLNFCAREAQERKHMLCLSTAAMLVDSLTAEEMRMLDEDGGPLMRFVNG